MDDRLFTARQFAMRCANWQEAVKLACLPLEKISAITADYADAIITTTEINGPWYVLSPHFALPHARPEEGVKSKESHLSLLCLAEGVDFPDHPAITLVIVLAAANSTGHLATIQNLVCWLDEDDRLQRLTAIASEAQLFEMLSQ